MKDETIAIADLKLDGSNPRHSEVSGTRQAIAALLEDDGLKLLALATHIKDAGGLNPIDRPLVMASKDGGYTVLEGNRRVASLMLLRNSGLARGTGFEPRFQALAKRPGKLPRKLTCAVARSREEAKPWIALRHQGPMGGVGVVPWTAAAKNRHVRQPGSQVDRAMIFLDAVSAAYPDEVEIQRDIASILEERLSTIGRLVSTPEVREELGLTFTPQGLRASYSASDLRPILAKILSDFAGKRGKSGGGDSGKSVSDLKGKDQRVKYINSVKPLIPKTALPFEEPQPLKKFAGRKPKTSKKKAAKKKAEPARALKPKQQQQQQPLLAGVNLLKLGTKIDKLVTELAKLSVDSTPHACAILLRCVIEIAVDEVYDKNSKKEEWAKYAQTDKKLWKRIRRCIWALDPEQKSMKQNDRYRAIRKGLDDQSSFHAIDTLQQFVHSRYYQASAADVRAYAANVTPFLTDLPTLV